MVGKAIWALLVVLAATGCATEAETEQTRMHQAFRQSRVDLAQCVATIHALPSWQALAGKLPPIDGTPVAMALQANRGRPNAEDVQALLELHRDGFMPCRKITLEDAGRAHPAFVGPMAHGYAVLDESYVRLVKGEIAWGDYARAYGKWQADTAQQIAEVTAQIHRELANAHAYEIQQRQAALESLSEWVRQQEVLNQQRELIRALGRPQVTRCVYTGSAVLNCQTY